MFLFAIVASPLVCYILSLASSTVAAVAAAVSVLLTGRFLSKLVLRYKYAYI
jgi:hypothetical protein